jgi:surface antigen
MMTETDIRQLTPPLVIVKTFGLVTGGRMTVRHAFDIVQPIARKSRTLFAVALCSALVATAVVSTRAGAATTVAYQITMPGSTSGLVNQRSGPGTNYPVVGTLSVGTTIDVVCQSTGTDIFGTSIWYQLSDGDYVTGYYTNLSTVTDAASPIPACTTTPALPAPTPVPAPLVIGDATLGQTLAKNIFVKDDYCTWYAEQRFHAFVVHYPALYPAGHTFLNVDGNAYQWKASAAADGWTITSTPTVDSIVVIQPGWDGVLSPDGHVAWVTAVGAGGQFTVAELNENLLGGVPNTSYRADISPYYKAGAGVSFILIPTGATSAQQASQ